jgi:superfamily II DNA or RNA helicase
VQLQVRNLGKDPVFSEFAVTNPTTQRTYRVVIRGVVPGQNYCTCPDYAVNTLGTCKHVEHLLHRLSARHGKRLRDGQRPPCSEVFVEYGAQRCVRIAFAAQAPADLKRLARAYFTDDGRLELSAIARFNQFLEAAPRGGHEVRVCDDAMAYLATVRDDETRRKTLARVFAGPSGTVAWKKLLKTPLYPYQREGALFAAQAGRAIIADEMGLGKTIQAIAAAEILARHCGVERVLVICPASLKYQWNREIERFSGRSPLVVEGMTHARRLLYEKPEGFFKIVNYDVVHRDLAAIAAWRPELVILDEAQRIKNWQTRAAKTVKQIESRYAIVLTGTPLENRIEELHSIVEFVDRFRLGPLFAFKAAHEEYEPESTKVIGYKNLQQINRTLSPILIRRTKSEVLKQLPPRMDKNFFVPMTSQQWVPHDENRDIVVRIVAKWRRYKFLTEADQLRLRIALQYMRMACDSTYLVDHETKHGAKVDELCRLLEEVFEDPGAKVVIFSQWVRMNELVAEMLEDRRWGFVHLHGGVPSKQRSELTRALLEEPDCRVFLSSDAGGVGLNLQSASTVVNMDLPWNPAVLEQRIGRVHRLGQGRAVRVVNFISEGTIEHGMLSLLAFKRSVFAGVLDGGSNEVFMGEGALNRFMKTVDSVTTSIPTVLATPVDDSSSGDDDLEAMPESAASKAPTSTIADSSSRQAAQPLTAKSALLDRETLSLMLSRGAELLQSIGQRLLVPPTASDAPEMPGGARIETDQATGRRELRVPIPEAQVLQSWVMQLADALRR